MLGLALIVVMGVGAQWLASRLRLPSILLLLGAGILVGPGLDWLRPDELFGDLLFPAIAMSVGLLLFEGGLGLRFDELAHGRTVLVRLITVSVVITWAVGTVAVLAFTDLELSTAALIGSILVVSGPTVVGPLLRLSRPREPSFSILRWEGILIDPVGALLAIVVLEAVLHDDGFAATVSRIVMAGGVGVGAGLVGAVLLVQSLKRHWVPDHLQNGVTLLVVVGSYAVAEHLQPEAGFFATTALGIALANQQQVAVGHIRQFEENLGELILGSLFIILGARTDLELVGDYVGPSLAIIAVLILIGRPLAVAAATARTDVPMSHRAFVAWMAPRGIVAAAVASVFSIELEEAGRPFEPVVPIVFTVIVGTVAIYGLTARLAARRLKIARAEPSGLLLLGAPAWALQLASAAAELGVPVLVVPTSRRELNDAIGRGLLTYSGDLSSEDLLLAVDGIGARQAIALSRASERNAYGIVRLVEALGRANVFHVPAEDDEGLGAAAATSAAGRRAFGADLTQERIRELLADGWTLGVLSGALVAGDDAHLAVPLLLVGDGHRADVPVGSVRPALGEQLIALVPPPSPEPAPADEELGGRDEIWP